MLLGLIGNPANRRIHFAAEAARKQGVRYRVFPWQLCPDWVDDIAACDLLKIDSAGEDAIVAQQLIELGSDAKANTTAALEYGELGFLAESYRGFCRHLDTLTATGQSFINSPASIKLMFDKWACHQRFVAAGVARPQSFYAPDTLADFLEYTQQQPSGRLFLKPLHGSSASGVLAFRWSGDKLQIMAPVEIDYKGCSNAILFNSLQLKSYLRFRDIKVILDQLLPQGLLAEQWLPKARISGLNVDVRIVVINGKAHHFIARKSPYPMTNLHLGGERVSETEFVSVFGESATQLCRLEAERAAACFPDALYAGVDVMLTPALKPVVLEINAFGDLLPNITYNGESTYKAILRNALEKTDARAAV